MCFHLKFSAVIGWSCDGERHYQISKAARVNWTGANTFSVTKQFRNLHVSNKRSATLVQWSTIYIVRNKLRYFMMLWKILIVKIFSIFFFSKAKQWPMWICFSRFHTPNVTQLIWQFVTIIYCKLSCDILAIYQAYTFFDQLSPPQYRRRS